MCSSCSVSSKWSVPVHFFTDRMCNARVFHATQPSWLAVWISSRSQVDRWPMPVPSALYCVLSCSEHRHFSLFRPDDWCWWVDPSSWGEMAEQESCRWCYALSLRFRRSLDDIQASNCMRQGQGSETETARRVVLRRSSARALARSECPVSILHGLDAIADLAACRGHLGCRDREPAGTGTPVQQWADTSIGVPSSMKWILVSATTSCSNHDHVEARGRVRGSGLAGTLGSPWTRWDRSTELHAAS
jgi:hypothetical protein